MSGRSALTCQRAEFSLPSDEHYLNCAYMGPLPLAAQQAGIEGIRSKGTPMRTRPQDFFTQSNEARALFARLIHADDPARVAIIPSVSYGIATVARNIRCSSGDRIVIAAEQFPSNVHMWRRLARETGAEIRAVAAPQMWPRGEHWSASILEAITDRTRLVALPFVHWTDGTRFDLEAIGERAREVGAAFVIDGTQSIGAMPFDVTRIGADAVICAAYKWLLGPYSLGFAWYGPRFDDGVPLEETWLGRERSEDFQRLVEYTDNYQPGATRYDMGERSNFQLMPIAIASMKLLHEWDAARIQDYCDVLCEGLIAHAVARGYTIEPRAWRGAHMFGMRVPSHLELDTLQRSLLQARVHVSLRGTALRIAANVYNDAEDVAALQALL